MSYSTSNPTARVKESRFGFTENRELVVENAVIMWSNFGGSPTKFNPNGGKRTFDLVLTERVAMSLISDGWNVKTVKSKKDEDSVMYVTEIAVNPSSSTVVSLCEEVNGKKYRFKVKPEDYSTLDTYQYSTIDLLIRPYVHGRENSAGSTIKGYLHQMNLVRLNDDYFREKYADYEDADAPSFPLAQALQEDDDDSDGWMTVSDNSEMPFM